MTIPNERGHVVDAGDGNHIWFSGTLMTVKAGGEQTRNGFTLIEVTTPHSFVVPPHIHEDEEEGFYILEGQLRVTCGSDTSTLGPGDFVMLPRGVRTPAPPWVTGGARLLQITAPPGFERFILDGGEPAPEPTVPPPGEPDVARILSAMAKHHKQMAQ